MSNAYADLHLHTSFSDGSDAPARVVSRAHELSFAAIAITDHDTLAGLNEGTAAAREVGMEFMPGVEISAAYGNSEVHVIGLGISDGEQALTAGLTALRDARQARVDKILEKLHKAGVNIARDEVEAQAGKADAIGRVHIARAIHVRGLTKTVQEAFDRYIGRGKKAFVPKKTITCARAVDLIHGAGGLAFVAHPGIGNTVQSILARLLTMPFDGIEVYHTEHTPGHVTQFLQVAQERHLLVSGGSDCHGTATGTPDMGRVRLPYEYFEMIKEELQKRRK
jgi:predicted metal-dependent phosphoesterase TrpH